MFRITEDPSSGNLVQCLAKNYKNDFIMSVGMDLVHANGHDRCFESQRIHHQGALNSIWLKITRMILSCRLTWTRSVL
jgi:hypothetical protein